LDTVKSVKSKTTVDSHSTLTSKRVNERGDVETVTDDIVAAGTNPDADGLNVTVSRVDALSKTKAKKLKGTVNSHSTLTGKILTEGAMGEIANVQNDIVAP